MAHRLATSLNLQGSYAHYVRQLCLLREPIAVRYGDLITVSYGGLITVSDYGQLVALVRVDKYLILIDFIYIYKLFILYINLVAGFRVADALTSINIFTHSQGVYRC